METTDGKRLVMAAGTILIIALIGFAKANHGNDTIVEEGGSRRSLQTLGFLGCYLGCGRFEFSMRRNDLINVRCRDYCASKAQIYAATHGDFCGCTSVLENLKPIVKPLNKDPMRPPVGVTGPGSPCDMACPGSLAGKRGLQCENEGCCGGNQAYSVFGAGKIPLEKQLAKRLMNSITQDEMKEVTRNTQTGDIDNVRIKFVLKPQGSDQMKVCTTTTRSLQCESLNEGSAAPIPPLTLTVIKFERDTRYSIPHKSEPVEGFSTAVDLSQAKGSGGKLTDTYTVEDTNTYTVVTTGGFEVSLEIENTVSIFGVSKNTVKAGFTGQFSASSENSHSVTTSNTITVEMTVPEDATGGTITMMKDYSELSVAWRAEAHVSGKVRVFLGGRYKDFQLTELLRSVDKTFFTGGHADYGEQVVITAIVKVTGRRATVPAKTTVKTKPEAVVDKGKGTVLTKDLPTSAGDTEDSITIRKCGTQMSSQYQKAGGIIAVSGVRDDKMVECETDFQKKREVCSISCKDTTDEVLYLFGGRVSRSTSNIWSGSGSRRQNANGMKYLATLDGLSLSCEATENLARDKHAYTDSCEKYGSCAYPNYCCVARINDGIKNPTEAVPLRTSAGYVKLQIARWSYINMIKLFVKNEKAVLDKNRNVKIYTWRNSQYNLCKSIDNGAWELADRQMNGVKAVEAYCPARTQGSWVKVVNNDLKSELNIQELEIWGHYSTARKCQRPNCCTRTSKCEDDEGYCDSDSQCKSDVCGQPGSCHWGGDLTTRCCQLMNRCNGYNDGCCLPEKPCLVGDGDCDYDYDCVGSMRCGNANCHSHGQEYQDDCCQPP